MQQSQLDSGLGEEQVRTLADWLTLSVFTQSPKLPETLKQEQKQQELRVVFVTVADNDGRYFTAPAMATGLTNAGQSALSKALAGFADITKHLTHSPQQLIKRIKIDVMSHLVPIDPKRVKRRKPIVSDRSLVGVILGNYHQAWLPEESLRHKLVFASGRLNLKAVKAHLAHRINDALVTKPSRIDLNTNKVWIFSTVSRLVQLKLKNDGQLTIENTPLLRNHRHETELNEDVALQVAQEGAAYIAHHTSPNGRMNYFYDAANDKNRKGYNILRHSGSLWSMLQVYKERPTVDLFRASHAALNFLKNRIVRFSERYPDVYVVAHDNEAKLGGNGLGLVALAAAYDELGAKEVLPLMQGLARWIVGTQAANGEFKYHKVYLDSLTHAPFTSDFYPGEAILGLMRLYKIDRNYRWLEAADKAARWLINVRDGNKSIEQLNRDHWLLYGLNDLYRALPRKEFVDHTRRIIACIQNAQLKNQPVPDLNGGFKTPFNVTATGCMCEGMLAGYKLLSDLEERASAASLDATNAEIFEKDELTKLEESIEAGLQAQLFYRFDEYNSTYLKNPKRAHGGFQAKTASWSIRVDFPQHSLTSFLMYWRATRG